MPAKSRSQQKFMGSEMSKMHRGKKTKMGMSAKQLGDFAGTQQSGLPERKKVGRGHWGADELTFAGGSCTEVPAGNMVNTAYRDHEDKELKRGTADCGCKPSTGHLAGM